MEFENTKLSKRRFSRHVLIDETLTASMADRLTIALQAIHDQQGLVFRDGFCYIILSYLVSYDLERMLAKKRSILSTHEHEQLKANGQEAIRPMWALDDLLGFWETFGGQLYQGPLPPPDSHGGRWSYDTIPPLWLPDEIAAVEHPTSELLYHEHDITPTVAVMVPASWKHWIEKLVEAFEGAEQYGVQLPIPSGTAVPEHPLVPRTEPNIFRRKGEAWEIAYQGHTVFLRHVIGLDYIAHLLCNPNQKFDASELERSKGFQRRNRFTRQPKSDQRALAEYREKWEDLMEQKKEAERCHDLGRVTWLEAQIEDLTKHLKQVTHNGQSTNFVDDNQTARTNVTKRIRDAIDRISEHNDELARHLANCIRTGGQCYYNPDPHHPITWSFL